jgi:predicted nuclease of predicted toxin-antitoxin system
MKFKIDENLPAELKDDFLAAGHDAETVVDENLAGAPDPQLISAIRQDNRILLTMDKGIADVRAYPPDQYAGIVLFRPRTQGRASTLEFVRRHLPALLTAHLSSHLLVVSDSGIRIR